MAAGIPSIRLPPRKRPGIIFMISFWDPNTGAAHRHACDHTGATLITSAGGSPQPFDVEIMSGLTELIRAPVASEG